MRILQREGSGSVGASELIVVLARPKAICTIQVLLESDIELGDSVDVREERPCRCQVLRVDVLSREARARPVQARLFELVVPYSLSILQPTLMQLETDTGRLLGRPLQSEQRRQKLLSGTMAYRFKSWR